MVIKRGTPMDKAKEHYNKLVKELNVLERKLFPTRYSYRAFLHEGEIYLQFPSDVVYPVKMVEAIMKNTKQKDFQNGSETVGMILKIPYPIKPRGIKPKKAKKNRSKSLKMKKKAILKRRTRK